MDVADELESQLREEQMMDRLLERPGKQYTDIQGLVSDFRIEQRREAEGAMAEKDSDSEETPAPARVARATHQHNGPQTGVKGVLADHAAAARYEHAERKAEEARAAERRQHGSICVKTVREDRVDETLEEGIEEDSDDDAFMKEYRQKRLLEMKAAAIRAQGRVQYGRLISIGPDEYEALLDDSDPRNAEYSIVHIGDVRMMACRRMNAKMDELAKKHPMLKFCETTMEKIEAEFDLSALPVLLIYKNGQVEQSFFKVTNQLGETAFEAYDLERLLSACGVVALPTED